MNIAPTSNRDGVWIASTAQHGDILDAAASRRAEAQLRDARFAIRRPAHAHALDALAAAKARADRLSADNGFADLVQRCGGDAELAADLLRMPSADAALILEALDAAARA